MHTAPSWPGSSGTGWTGVVLAGGRSSRMGRDKALITIDGRLLLDRALDTLQPHVNDLLVIGDPEKYGHVGPFVMPDDVPGIGPLGGISTALHYALNDRVMVVAVDMPNVNGALIERLKLGFGHEMDAYVPACDGAIEPLVAAYHRRCRPVFEGCIAKGLWKVSDALAKVKATYVQICPGEEDWPADLFKNLNSPSDL
ncbi:MAG: molybdenum cofactor guanylyltransferase [Flavobacteriales bacterium]|nr:molybdenum cofactor guanylyltransferase [Flavobacteriales bacterium]